MEWSSLSNRDRRSVPLGKRLKSLALRDRLRILRRKTEAGKWKENGYQLAGPSGFIRDGEPIEGPAPEPANELRETLVELFRVNCSVEWWYVTFDQIGARVGRTKKAVQFQIRRLERDGLLRISPKDESQGRYTNGYLYVGPAATDALKQRKHEAAVAAGRDVLKYCNLVADLPYEGPSPYPTYPAAYKSGSKSDGNYIRKEKSRALTNRWGS
jgi:hypothetical protein